MGASFQLDGPLRCVTTVGSPAALRLTAFAAPASAYVITHKDIAGSGAASLPEILRLAPNLVEVDLRHVGSRPNPRVTSYTEVNGRPAPNLNDPIQRSFVTGPRWRF